MNVLLLTEYFPRSEHCEVRGGVEARSFYLAREIARHHRVDVICAREPGQGVEEELAGVRVHRTGPVREYKQAGSLAVRGAFLVEAIRAARKIDADIVDSYNFLAYVAATQIAREKDIPRVATYHDVWLGEWIRNLGLVSGIVGEVVERYVLAHRWDQIIANSEYTRQKLAAAGARAAGMEVVYNGIALDAFEQVRVPRAMRPTVCYVGRLVRYKRVNDLIDAIHILRARVPDVKLEIVGSGPDAGRLAAQVSRLGLENHVEFHGFVQKHHDVLEVMARSHVLCLPSAVEGFGMAIVEAMACGTPVVASALEPIREVTREGQGALLYPCGDVAALADHLTTMLTDTALHSRYVIDARALAADYDWRPLAAKVERIYETVRR
ncbi:MAG: glycosyltransferase family 4 protein [Kofleriaceae bacterium]